MTSPSHRDRTLSPALSAAALAPTPGGPSAAETVRFPTAATYAAALELAQERAGKVAPEVSLRELRLLLEENLTALRAVYEDQRRTIASALRNVETAREELRALSQPEAPWIEALDQTRSLIRASFAEIAAQHTHATSSRR